MCHAILVANTQFLIEAVTPTVLVHFAGLGPEKKNTPSAVVRRKAKVPDTDFRSDGRAMPSLIMMSSGNAENGGNSGNDASAPEDTATTVVISVGRSAAASMVTASIVAGGTAVVPTIEDGNP